MVKKYGDTRKKMNVDAEVMNSIFYNGKVLKLEWILSNLYRQYNEQVWHKTSFHRFPCWLMINL